MSLTEEYSYAKILALEYIYIYIYIYIYREREREREKERVKRKNTHKLPKLEHNKNSQYKREHMCFNLRSDISTPNGCSLELVEKFTYLRSSVLSIKTNKPINRWLAEALTAFDWLSVKRRAHLNHKMKRSFFSKQRLCRYCYMDARHGR